MNRSNIIFISLFIMLSGLVAFSVTTRVSTSVAQPAVEASKKEQQSSKKKKKKSKGSKKPRCKKASKGKILGNLSTGSYSTLSENHCIFKNAKQAKRFGFSTGGSY